MNTGELGGYRDISVILRSPSGFNVELQINTTHMQRAKGNAHALYEERRKIKENGVARELTRAQAHRVKMIDLRAREQFDRAMIQSARRIRPGALR